MLEIVYKSHFRPRLMGDHTFLALAFERMHTSRLVQRIESMRQNAIHYIGLSVLKILFA